MPIVVHEIDPDPDTVIVLKRPTKEFAAWNDSFDVPCWLPTRPAIPTIDSKNAIVEEWAVPISKKVRKMGKRSVEVDIPVSPSVPVLEEAPSSFTVEVSPSEDMSQVGTDPDKKNNEDEDAVTNDQIPEEADEVFIHYRVSSRHLITASPRFKTMLSGEKWTESERDPSDGLFHISAEDWDPDAFLIILDIFHLKHRRVTRVVSLEMLAKIAILVDYYDCAEAIELFTEMWIDHLKKCARVPSTYCRDLVLWIWVAWVFKMDAQFTKATLIAIKQSRESIRILDLPIPDRVTELMDNTRHQIIENVFASLFDWLEMFRSRSYVCSEDSDLSFQCGSFLFGTLTREMDLIGFLDPRPEIPFDNMSFDDAYARVRAMSSPVWAVPLEHVHACGFEATVHKTLETISNEVKGLKLSNF